MPQVDPREGARCSAPVPSIVVPDPSPRAESAHESPCHPGVTRALHHHHKPLPATYSSVLALRPRLRVIAQVSLAGPSRGAKRGQTHSVKRIVRPTQLLHETVVRVRAGQLASRKERVSSRAPPLPARPRAPSLRAVDPKGGRTAGTGDPTRYTPKEKTPRRLKARASWEKAEKGLISWTSGAHMLWMSSFSGTCGGFALAGRPSCWFV